MTDHTEERPMWPAAWDGFKCRCPNCHKGKLLKGYLKVQDTCPECGEAFSHHRADDGPAYLTILIVGHIMGPLLLWAFVEWRPDPLVLFAIFTAGSVAMSLYLLPRFKGAIVGIQWAKRMHGFAPKLSAKEDFDPHGNAFQEQDSRA